MKKKLNILTLAYLIFLVLLFLSGYLSGGLSDTVYYLAFIVPIGLCLFLTREEGIEWKKHLTLDKDAVMLSWPLVFPTVAVIIIISFLTSFLIYELTGKTNSADLGDSYILALFTHALIPAVFEEALFRYLPLRLIAPHSSRCAIIVSAIFFALVHTDLFVIPYALIAGVILMSITIATDSIIPSIIIHFINNALSVTLYFIYFPGIDFLVYIWIGLLAILSIIVILRNREEYEIPLLLVTEKGEGIKFTPLMISFAAITLALAIIKLRT